MGNTNKDEIGKLDRDGAVHLLKELKAELDKIRQFEDDGIVQDLNSVRRTLAILKEAGQKVGYTPAFRCLVMGMSPEESVRWGK